MKNYGLISLILVLHAEVFPKPSFKFFIVFFLSFQIKTNIVTKLFLLTTDIIIYGSVSKGVKDRTFELIARFTIKIAF